MNQEVMKRLASAAGELHAARILTEFGSTMYPHLQDSIGQALTGIDNATAACQQIEHDRLAAEAAKDRE